MLFLFVGSILISKVKNITKNEQSNWRCQMKVIKTGKMDWTAVSADGRVLSNGYHQTTPAAARRIGERLIAIEAIRHLNGDSAAIAAILELS